jgi:hypothetical protein
LFFFHGTGKGNGKEGYDKKYWKDSVTTAKKKGHPSSHCPNKEKNDNEKDNDNKSTAASLKKIRE